MEFGASDDEASERAFCADAHALREVEEVLSARSVRLSLDQVDRDEVGDRTFHVNWVEVHRGYDLWLSGRPPCEAHEHATLR